MSEGLKFIHDFFTKKKINIQSENEIEVKDITVTLDERPSFDISSEDYRFRIKIAEVIDEVDIFCRDMAIEDHHKQEKHQKPHLQFKLHADGIGPIHIFLPISTVKDYKKYILSFLDIISEVLIAIDNDAKELQTTFMIMDNFKAIKGMGSHIKKLISVKYTKDELKLLTDQKKERTMTDDDVKKIKEIPQISPFFENVKL